ncbi:hypothetical protein [Desulfovibrio gilichinskyi]|uniref:Uncharacterized protein n=1 Tax=Desulfovibrio gilichinskyi TaxID=1519643 RepID=A0A1X7DQE6_9BACT|nr:hypothetical protein [Desulfovibrio gilichinskyi]SMF19406.1 hypothetical protein SAMN06295933_2174 [Desulfovibrio gilichinskyi]
MAQKNVKMMMGVLSGVFVHTGNLTKEEAMKMADMNEDEFKTVYEKAAHVVKKLESYDTAAEKYDKFSEHLWEELQEYVRKFGPFGV